MFTSGGHIMSDPLTSQGPIAWILNTLGSSSSIVADNSFRESIISVTSSLTPGTVENS